MRFAYASMLLGGLAWMGAAYAQDAADLSVTIYNSNLGLVQDTRQLNIAAGRSRLEFRDVSASIRPETTTLAASGVSIVEQNFDFDLLSPDKLMEKAVGSQVRVIRTNPGSGKETEEIATVLSVNNGVVLRIGNRIEVLRDDGAPTRVVFDKVPDNLRARPTLSVSVQSESAGTRPATLSYLTTGLSWKADYVALFDDKKGALDLQGWITLTNSTGTTFTNARTRLVAGDVSLSVNDFGDTRYRPRVPTPNRAAGSEGGDGQFADFYIYPLAQRTTIADKQTKQVGFLEAVGVRAAKGYEYNAGGFYSATEPAHVDAVVKFSNAKAAGLGAALPAGAVRVYVRDQDGQPRFIGESEIDHTPAGSELAVKTGEAFDVTIQPTLVANNRESASRTRFSMSYLVRNARAEPVIVDVRQSGLRRDGRVIEESLKSTRVNSSTLLYRVNVPGNGEATLTFTVDSTR